MKKLLLLTTLAFSFLIGDIYSQCPPPGYPPVSMDCPSAPFVCTDLDGYCDVLSSVNIQQTFPGCNGNVLNNDSWFAFVAGTSAITLQITPSNCQNQAPDPQGMQAAIYEGTCNGPAIASQCNCVQGPFQLSSTNFVPGQNYYIVFDGCGGDICDFEVDVLVGSTVPAPPADPGPILGPVNVCPGATTEYTLNVPNGANYEWSLIPAIGTVSGSPGAPITVSWGPTPGTAQLCVISTNECGGMAGPSCISITSQPVPPTTETYDLCVGDCVQCAGQTFCAATPPTGTPVPLVNAQGCDSIVNCVINAIVIPPTDLGQETFCSPASFEVCGNFYNQSGIYTTTCESYQGCDSTVTVDLAIFDPMSVITEPAPTLGCGGSGTVMLDGIGSNFPLVPGAQVFFEWTGPGIVGPNNDVQVEVNMPGEYCLTVTHERNGVSCSDTDCIDVMQDADLPMQPTLTGETNPCQGDVVSYTVTPNGTPAPTGYTWTTPNGEPITQTGPNSVEVTWNNATGGQLCVTADNDCGESDPECITITIQSLPISPVIDGETTACATSQTEIFTVSNVEPGATYTWTANNGASTIGSGSSIQVDFSGATGTVDVCVTSDNGCGDEESCIQVAVTPLALTPTLSGPTTVCSNGGPYNFSVDSPQSGVTFNWTAPAPAVISGTGANVTIDFAGATTGQVCVSATNTCGTSTQACQNVTVIQAPTAEISGGGTFCEGTVPNINLTISLTGTGPWDVEYTLDGANPTSINIASSPYTLTVNQEGTYELITLTAGGLCDGSVSGSATVTENPAPTAMLSGTGSICAGSGDPAQLTIDLTGTAPWEVCWEVDGDPQAPLNINTTPYTLNVSQAQAGDITISCVTDGNDCEGDASGNATVSIEEAPSVSMIMTPCNGTNTDYTVIFTVNGGDPGTYQVEPNTGTWDGNEYTSAPIPSGDGYSFEIFDANGCDTVIVSDNAVICDCESATGTMDLTPLNLCGNELANGDYDLTGQNYDGDDITNFVLHSGSGTSIVPPIVGQYALPTSISFQDPPMMYGVTYYLSAVVGNNDGSGMVDLDDPCLAVSQGTPVTWYEEPNASLGLGAAICEGQDTFLTVGFTGTGPWSITYDDGSGTQTLNGITDNPYNLVVSPTVTTEYCLTAMSDVNCDGMAAGCATVTVNTGVMVSNIQTTCNATATAYVVTFEVTGGDPGSYVTTGNPGSIVGGVFTSDEIPTGSGYNIVVDDANGCSPQTVSASIVVCDCETDAGAMSPDLITYCSDGPTADVQITNGENLDANDILLYVLHTAASNTLGTEIAWDNVPTNFTFDDVTMDYGITYYISAVAGNDDGSGSIDLTDPCLSVAPGTPVVFYAVPTATISGGQEICPGETADLMIELTGDSPWSVTINGDVIDNINGTPYTYSVTPATTTTYTLTLVEDENCFMDLNQEQTVTVHVPPSISAIDEECNATGTAYTVTIDIIDGDPTCYQVTPPSGVLTGSQFVSDEITAGAGYNFTVTDCHGCPADVATAPAVDCNCLSMVGNMTGPNLSICGNDDATAVYDPTGEFLDADDVLCYFIHDGSNVPLATNTTEPVFNFLPGLMNPGQTYYICAAVGNAGGSGCVDFSDNCTVIGGCTEVVFNQIPTAILSGDGNICEGENSDLTIDLTGVGPWEIFYQNAGGTPTSVTATSSPWTIPVAPDASTVFSLVSMTDANCDGTVSGNATVSVNEPPQAINTSVLCDATGTFYNVSFEIIGGDPSSYSVNPSGNLVGGSFTSANIPSGDTYQFLVDDGNQCGPFEVSGIFVCDCDTDAGTMENANTLNFCVDSDATGIYNGGQILEPDDVFTYVLHTNSGNSLGVVLATNPTDPTFTFDPGAGMMTGTIYYISAVAGDDDGTGNYDPDDPCLSVAPGTPIIFNELPTISISDDVTICEGDMATITLTMTGEAPFTATFLQNGTLVTLPSLQEVFNLNVDENVTIQLVGVEDNSSCQNTSAESATVTVNPSVSAGLVTDNPEFCESDPTILDLNSLLTDADLGGTWTGPSGNVPGGSLNVASLTPGTGTYTYFVDADPPCPDDEVSLEVTIQPEPSADAGEDQIITCDTDEVTIGGTGTSTGLTYEWTNDLGDVISNDLTPTVTTPGTYTLSVSNALGCSSTDEVEVDESVDSPEVGITDEDVRCYGETNGFITIDSIIGGVPPYLVSINGGPFLSDLTFLNLAPGDYTLVVEDNAGCQTEVPAFIGEPTEVDVVIDNDFGTDDPIIPLGGSTDLTALVTPSLFLDTTMTLVWSTGETTPEITVTPLQQTTYSVSVQNGNGCRDEALFTIFISKDRPVFIPNAFSPNDDGKNDVFQIYAGNSVAKVKSFLVFSRWGETVFEFYEFDPKASAIGWNGKHHDEYLNPGVFTYFAEIEFIDGSIELYEGDVNLLR